MKLNSHGIINFSQVDKVDPELIGKKAQMLGDLKYLGIPIQDGFVITASFLKEFLDRTGILEDLKKVQSMQHPAIEDSRSKMLEPVRKKIMQTPIPWDLAIQLHDFYRKLSGIFKESLLNIYSSAKENKSIAFYDIKGDTNLILKIKTLLAYYLDQPFSVIAQKAVKSKNKKSIVTNDSTISDQNLLKLAKRIQKHFYFPKVIEYFIEKGKVFVTQVKPFTGIVEELKKEKQQINNFRKAIAKGVSINPGIVTGTVKLIINHNFTGVRHSEIAVIRNLDRLLYNKIKMAKGIVTDAVLRTPIDKLHYKEIVRIPTITGCKNAWKLLQNGSVVTINGSTGEIYSGGLIY